MGKQFEKTCEVFDFGSPFKLVAVPMDYGATGPEPPGGDTGAEPAPGVPGVEPPPAGGAVLGPAPGG